MDFTLCPDCGAITESVVVACPSCGFAHPEHITNLEAGEAVYACGNCRRPRYMRRTENPAVNQDQFARIIHGVFLSWPLTVWNTVFNCANCHGWNWVTLDDRISGFELPCPECGTATRLETLGRHWGISRRFLQPLALGEWRAAGKHLALRCGHRVYLPAVLAEGAVPVVPERQPVAAGANPAEPTSRPPTPAPAPRSSPPTDDPAPHSGHNKTQPISLVPPHH